MLPTHGSSMLMHEHRGSSMLMPTVIHSVPTSTYPSALETLTRNIHTHTQPPCSNIVIHDITSHDTIHHHHRLPSSIHLHHWYAIQELHDELDSDAPTYYTYSLYNHHRHPSS